jgi:hypothetical protein
VQQLEQQLAAQARRGDALEQRLERLQPLSLEALQQDVGELRGRLEAAEAAAHKAEADKGTLLDYIQVGPRGDGSAAACHAAAGDGGGGWRFHQ